MLRALDAEAALVGASRAVGTEAMSVARLVGSPAAVAACAGWATDYVTSSTTTNHYGRNTFSASTSEKPAARQSSSARQPGPLQSCRVPSL